MMNNPLPLTKCSHVVAIPMEPEIEQFNILFVAGYVGLKIPFKFPIWISPGSFSNKALQVKYIHIMLILINWNRIDFRFNIHSW